MVTKIIIPVINTEDGKYEYRGTLSTEDYENMVYDKYRNTNAQMEHFVYNMTHGISNIVPSRFSSTSERDYPDIKYDFYETDVYIQDSKKNDIDISYFDEYIGKEKMLILILNINPNMEPDAESELRFWIDDSLKIHNDNSLDTKTKLKSLPERGLKLLIGDKEHILDNCKILQNYSDNKYPFKFAIIIEKIV